MESQVLSNGGTQIRSADLWSASLTNSYCVNSLTATVNEIRSGAKLEEARTSPSSEKENQENVPLIPNFKQFLGWLIAHVSEVRAVLVKQTGKALEIYVGVDEFNMQVNEKIYDVEEQIIDGFLSLEFDFHIISLHGRPSIEVISDPELEEVLAR